VKPSDRYCWHVSGHTRRSGFEIFFDEVENLEPWGYLMGNAIPPIAEVIKERHLD